MSTTKLKENYIIRIHACAEQEGEPDNIDLMTRGSFQHKNGCYYIIYKESEATGFAGCTTTLKVAEDGSRVAMLRFGAANTQLILECGRRNLCHYETGFGSMTLGVTADEIRCELTERGGALRFSYLLDNGNTQQIGRNSLDITVTHIN